MNEEPLIVAIDDDEGEVRPKKPDGFRLEVLDPIGDRESFSKQASSLIGSACLILLDQKFRDDPTSISLDAQDGSSFVSHLRSWSRSQNEKLAPIVMFTNEESAFANEVPAVGAAVPIGGTFVGREHRLSPTLDVEWIQFKADAKATDKLEDLARAFLAVRDAVGKDGISLDEISKLLLAPLDAVWAEQAREQLQNARPPVNQKGDKSAEPTRGPSQVIRWLCQKALPYPGLLLSDHYAAWALGISLVSFMKVIALEKTTPWLSELHEVEYSGPLRGFMGRRWWRAGLDQLVWLLDEETAKGGSRKKALEILAPGVDFGQLLPPSSHVVVCNEDLIEVEVTPIGEAIQVHPPGWPAEAIEPWMRRSEIERDPVLKAMVDPNDLI